jgi:hypothetical protein
MKRLMPVLTTMALIALGTAPAARADFGIHDFEAAVVNQDGSPATQAGSHPFAVSTSFKLNTRLNSVLKVIPDGEAKEVRFKLPAGFAGSPLAAPTCSTTDFLTIDGNGYPACADNTAVGATRVEVDNFHPAEPVYNLVPPPGVAAKLGFIAINTPITVEVGLNEDPPYNIVAAGANIPQTIFFYGARFQLWGVPGDKAHDPFRGRCLSHAGEGKEFISVGNCPGSSDLPLITLPRSCNGPLVTSYEATSWQEPDAEPDKGSFASPGMTGCSKLEGFSPRIESLPTTASAETGTGLDFNVDIHDEGLTNPTGYAQSDIKKAVVTLPEGMTINPSVGEGLGVCTPAQLKRETLRSIPGAGCPGSSKLGTLHVTTPLVKEAIDGEIFLAPQDDASTTQAGAENPFDSLIALYFVLKNPTLGAILKLPVKVEPDPLTGQILVTLDDSPEVPIDHFNAHLRTGARAALITPNACGTHTTKTVFTPSANPTEPFTTSATFQVTSGVNGGPCPPGGVPPFHPDFQAGAINNNAGSFSPFNMRLIRSDGEQDMTKFSSVLPPGELGSLAGVSKCPDSAIDVAKAKTGRQELASPSCPANSLIGHTLAGAGVGNSLTYVGGQVYLGGPFHGDPLSVISITPAVAGPFDAGTVVVHLALTLNPKTAEVEVDGAASDPIPHILKGIVLKVRDLRVYVDRPNFTLNPTSCEESSAKGTLFGSYLNVFDPSDDRPVDLSTRYQAANCLNLGFKPKLDLKLKGGTKRGGHPGLTATYTPRKGDANVKGLVVRLPRSAFLDQAHIRTICTRVQFAAKACPKGAQYGFIKAWTPLLDTPLEGPVYLRSSNHKLPDLVFDLHGLVDVEVATRIDSAQGGIRASIESAPDAPLSKVVVQMQGAKKGLIVNSRDLCVKKSKADVEFTGHNGKEFDSKPVMRADCGK